MRITKEDPADASNEPDAENPYTTENKLQVQKNDDIDFGGGQIQDDRPEDLLKELNEFLIFHLLMFLFSFYLGEANKL